MWTEAIAAVATLATRLLGRAWGTRTRQEDTLEKDLEKAEATFADALKDGDAQRATTVYEQLVRLRDKAKSRRARG